MISSTEFSKVLSIWGSIPQLGWRNWDLLQEISQLHTTHDATETSWNTRL